MGEKDKIQEILASQDRQLQIDAIKIIEQEENVSDKEKAFKILTQNLISQNKEFYPIQGEKAQEEKRKYTETFYKAIQEEQRKKESERLRKQRKINQVLRAYGKESKIKNDEKYPENILKKYNEIQYKNKTLLMQVQEIVEKVKGLIDEGFSKETIEKITEEKRTPTHQEFMERMKPSTMQEIQHIEIEKTEEDREI